LLPELDDDWLDADREQYRRRQLNRLGGLARDAEAARGISGCGTMGGRAVPPGAAR
jgi:hypothetical protein